MNEIHIFDTTLRDGEQAPHHQMSIAQKVALFNLLDAAGVDFIEIGFPAASKIDFVATKILAQLNRRACISVFSRMTQSDIDIAAAAVNKKENVQLQLLAVGSEIHLEKKRKITADRAIEELTAAIQYSRASGFQNISIGLEDALRGSLEWIHRLAEISIQHNVNTLVIADTVGGAIPSDFYELITDLRLFVGDKIQLSVHCHNDMGLAVANAMEAIRAGADCVQTTLCGIGERAGNSALEEILTILHYKPSAYLKKADVDLKKIYQACHFLVDALKLSLSYNKPILGENAFATTAGIHINGILSDPNNYEFVEPNLFGRERSFAISRLSGKSLIAYYFNKIGLPITNEQLEAMRISFFNEMDSSKYKSETDLLNLYFEEQTNRDFLNLFKLNNQGEANESL